MSDYDSKADTLEHIKKVQSGLLRVIRELTFRADAHDTSKLEEGEKETFDKNGPRLKQLVYGSEEYKKNLEKIKDALSRHYAVNTHHPENFPNGINGMSLIDLIELLCDWKAATERTKDGDIKESIRIGSERFGISPQLTQILLNTIDEMGW